MKIGIFDSGVGGQSFVDALKVRFPTAEIVYKDDKKNVPYGDKTPVELLALTLPVFRQFEAEGCDAVLVACNTVTTNIIDDLRREIQLPLIGVEPMIKPAAAMSKTKNIAVCATPGTLGSKRYGWLKEQYAIGVKVVEPDCSGWSYMIEYNRKNELDLRSVVEDLRAKNVDVVVLGCTHYHWIEEELQALANPDMQVIQPIDPILDQLEKVLSKLYSPSE
jgi:glutamate racemase